MYSPTSANSRSMVCDRSDDMKWNVHFCKKIELFTENDFGTISKQIKPTQGNSIQYCNAKVTRNCVESVRQGQQVWRLDLENIWNKWWHTAPYTHQDQVSPYCPQRPSVLLRCFPSVKCKYKLHYCCIQSFYNSALGQVQQEPLDPLIGLQGTGRVAPEHKKAIFWRSQIQW